jgi:hypothetical protein
MASLKELRRIEAAIIDNNKKEVIWAFLYCKNRLKLSKTESENKQWQTFIDKLIASN